MKVFNTLTRKLEEFKPIDDKKVGMYTCGPTVYDYQHIGNFRTMTLSDFLYRILKYNGYEIKSVKNITDIDDKIIRNASERGMPIKQYSQEYTRIFFEDSQKLNILPPDVTTYATEYIDKMISYIKELIKKGYAYVEKDGSVYFEISKFRNYGRLSQLDMGSLKTGTRALSDEYTKENVQDFALWKATKPGEIQNYDSPWGKGRPGWHIECSVMSQDNLGETIDIHVGGVDLLFPHHENEIAQSEAKTGKPFVRYWIHGEFLNVDGGKMSKSLKNFYTLNDVEGRGYDPLSLRYLYMTAHYRSKLNFTWEALDGAAKALERLRNKTDNLNKAIKANKTSNNIGCAGYEQEFLEAINNDLNMPQALAVVWKLVEDESMPAKARLTSLLRFDKVLGLSLSSSTSSREIEIPRDVQKLIDKRGKLRKEKKFDEADKVRMEIEELGFKIEDPAL